ncbi:MAG: GNA1162 family protein [Candidatus Hydrogenedentota bacterium]
MRKHIFQWIIGSGLVFCAVIFLIVACSSQPHLITNYGTSPEIFNRNAKLKVAVLPFRNATGVGGVGVKICEEFTIQLLKNENITVLERTRIDDLIKELQISDYEEIEGNTAMRLGKMLQADAVLIGTVYKYRPVWIDKSPPEIGLSARLVMVETGQTLWAGSDSFRGDDYSVQLLVPPQERWKIRENIKFLSEVLCRELAKTIGS